MASDGERLTAQGEKRFVAAAIAQQQTGCPILTHTDGGTDAFAQVDCLIAHGAAVSHVVLSHCDKNRDVSFHRDLLQAGVCLVVGMDLARQKYWRGYGGQPGLAWMLTDFLPTLRSEGLSAQQIARISIHNAANAYAFRPRFHGVTGTCSNVRYARQ